MAEKVTNNRLATSPSVDPGAVSYVKTPAGDAVQGYVTGTNGVPLPFLVGAGGTGGIVFLTGPGTTPPSPPANSTIYVNLEDKIMYLVGPSGEIFVLPIGEGSLLAKLYYEFEETPVSATGNTPTTMVDLTRNFTPGVYMIDVSYGWTNDSTGNDFIAEVLFDGNPIGQPHQQEPQDSAGSVAWTNTNQLHTASKRLVVTIPSAGQHTVLLQFRNTNNTATSCFDASILAWNLTEMNA